MTSSYLADLSIFVTDQFVGFHRWAAAPDHLAYLRSPHRHVFKVTVKAGVTHGDREVEFHELKSVLVVRLQKLTKEMSATSVEACKTFSCEQIATSLLQFLRADFPSVFLVEVSEDGECGATYSEIPYAE